MNEFSRRNFLRHGAFGLATLGLGALVLRADAAPTEPSGDLGDYGKVLAAKPKPSAASPSAKTEFAVTEDNILGPFYREGAPFRAKVTPPLAAGTVLVVTGRVWGHDTRQPLARAVLDIWQANHAGRYDNDDSDNPPAAGVFKNRARLVADEDGRYEFETIHPGGYQTGRDMWRPSHIHYMVRAPGYKTLVTQLYFKGDPRNAKDPFIRDSLIIEVAKQKIVEGEYETGTFDIVLAKA